MPNDIYVRATKALSAFVASTGDVPVVMLDAARRHWLRTVLATERARDSVISAVDDVIADLGISSAVDSQLGGVSDVPAQWRAFRLAIVAGATEANGSRPLAPAMPVVCGALAVSDPGASVGLLLSAIARGVEVSVRLGSAFATARPDSPWDTSAISSRFGVVAAAAGLLRLDPAQVVHAFGISGGQAGGLSSASNGVDGRGQLAKAVFDGVEASLLAQRGFTASDDIVAGDGGAGDVLYYLHDDVSAVAGLGETWRSADHSDPSAADGDLVAFADMLVRDGRCSADLRSWLVAQLDGIDLSTPISRPHPPTWVAST